MDLIVFIYFCKKFNLDENSLGAIAKIISTAVAIPLGEVKTEPFSLSSQL
jgi:hypothetical protein